MGAASQLQHARRDDRDHHHRRCSACAAAKVSRFLTKLRLEAIEDMSLDDRGSWLLTSPLIYVSDVAGITITAPEGFITDLASVPRIPFAFELLAGIGHSAAVIHDVLYSYHVTTRRTADAVFHEALLLLGVPKAKAWAMWAGVRIGGRGPWNRPGQLQLNPAYAQFTDREAP